MLSYLGTFGTTLKLYLPSTLYGPTVLHRLAIMHIADADELCDTVAQCGYVSAFVFRLCSHHTF